MIRDENFINIAGWMINRLHLSGNDLLVYAVIYGFTQDGESWYDGSRSYLAEFIGTSERTIVRILERLVSQGLLQKDSSNYKGVNFCQYRAVTSPMTKCHSGDDKMSWNNKIDNKDPSNSACAREEVSKNHPADFQEVVDFAAQCGVPITKDQAEIFIAKNSVTAQGSTWMYQGVPVRNWRAIVQTWLPGWRKDFTDAKKSEAPPKTEGQRNPKLEAEGYRWIPQLGRHETEDEKIDREAGLPPSYKG